jgi:hypothetical protein
VYTHSSFPGTITITGLQFFNTQYDSGATSMSTGPFTFSLSTTTADWNTLSSTYAANIGADNTTVFNGSLSQPWAFGDTPTISFTTPFTYNPADGNLLLDVVANTSGGGIYFGTNGYNGDIRGNRRYSDCLNPGSYTKSQKLARELLGKGSSRYRVPERKTLRRDLYRLLPPRSRCERPPGWNGEGCISQRLLAAHH